MHVVSAGLVQIATLDGVDGVDVVDVVASRVVVVVISVVVVVVAVGTSVVIAMVVAVVVALVVVGEVVVTVVNRFSQAHPPQPFAQHPATFSRHDCPWQLRKKNPPSHSAMPVRKQNLFGEGLSSSSRIGCGVDLVVVMVEVVAVL